MMRAGLALTLGFVLGAPLAPAAMAQGAITEAEAHAIGIGLCVSLLAGDDGRYA
jgi:hypothetical protein